ncbi:MAG: YeiH family putative sulfate export transporter [Sulfurospirillum sp.]|nr:YeiH family putative sulfate export transporter [Sulfurospirillum sp.]MBL0702500.1 YeiH family putative sulfate export transporter [Sulfurospirillum sp.]
MFSKVQRQNTLSGVLFVALFATTALHVSEFSFFKNLGISPLIVGIVLGIAYANTLRNHLPKEWVPGIIFSTKTLLRVAIAFYGFRITFQGIAEVGIAGVFTSATIVILTFLLGYFIGVKILKLDVDTTILTTAGSSICGAAAVLATEPILKSEPHKSAVAVSTVVIFGTIAMFLYPFLYKTGYIDLDSRGMGIFIGGTLHEVAHVVGAGNTLGDEVASNAVIVKMLRVMMLAPFLVILGVWLTKKTDSKQKNKIAIPWFAVAFIGVAGINSLNLLSATIVTTINTLDTFALTMAMCALGMETNFKKFKDVGMKPIYLSLTLFIWLIFGGYYITKLSINM